MKKQRASLILIVVLVMSAVLAPAAQAQGLVEYALVLGYNMVETSIGPVYFAASSGYEGDVTATLWDVETSEIYQLHLVKDTYILDLDTRERVGLRLSGQATTADGASADAIMIVSNTDGGIAIIVIVVTLPLHPTIYEFEEEGILSIETPYSATDPLVNAQIEPQTVDADGDGVPAESVSGSLSVSADGNADGSLDVSYADGSRLGFYPIQGFLSCTNGLLELELIGPLFRRHPDGSTAQMVTWHIELTNTWVLSDGYIDKFMALHAGDGDVIELRFYSMVDFDLNVNSCP